MKINNIKKSGCTSTEWSGGTTTELLILPEESSYIKRNFRARLSTATVEKDSDFTNLSGIMRDLMILDGTITLNIEEEAGILLKKYDRIVFDGGKKVKSQGSCVDLNLMLHETEGELELLELDGDCKLELDTNYIHIFLIQESNCMISGNCLSGDNMILAETSQYLEKIDISCLQKIFLIHAKIKK